MAHVPGTRQAPHQAGGRRRRLVAYLPPQQGDQVAALAVARRESRSVTLARLLAAGLAAQQPTG